MTSDFKTDVEGRWPYSWNERIKVLELDFPTEEYELRLQKLYALMDAKQLEVAIVYGGPNNAANIRYLTGWPSTFGDSFAIVSRKRDPVVISNSIFHGEPMHSNIQTCWVKDFRPLKLFGTVLAQRSIVDCVIDALGEFGYAQSDVGAQLGKALNYSFLSEVTGKSPKALGAQQ